MSTKHDQEVTENNPLIENEYRVYKRRWWIVSTFSLVTLTQSAFWITYNSVGTHTNTFYHTSQALVNFLAALGNIWFVVFVPFASWMLQNLGLRLSVIVATLLFLGCGLLRCLAQKPQDIWLVIVAQSLNAISGPILGAAPPQISAVWFPPHQRTLSTAIMGLSSSIGPSLSFLMGFMVQEDNQLMTFIYWQAIMSIIISSLIFIYFPDEPPTPPSPSSSILLQRENDVSVINSDKVIQTNDSISVSTIPSQSLVSLTSSPKVPTFFTSVKQALSCSSFVLLMIAVGLSEGAYGGWESILMAILQPLGWSQDEVGWLGFASIAVGCTVGLIIARIADLWFLKRLKMLMLILSGVAGLCFLWLSGSVGITFVFLPHNKVLVFVACILSGIALNALVPLAYEMGVELTFPVAGGTSGGIITFMWNLGALIYVAVDNLIPPEWMNWLCTGSILLSMILLWLIKEKYQRLNIDDQVLTSALEEDSI